LIPPILRENRDFRVYFAGQAISLFGDQISLIALPLVGVLVLHATPAEMGYLTTAALLPNLLFSLHAGAWVDRRGRRRQTMIAADFARAALLGLGFLFSLMTLLWLTAYAVAVARAGDFLSRSWVKRAIEAITGAVLVALGLRLATERR